MHRLLDFTDLSGKNCVDSFFNELRRECSPRRASVARAIVAARISMQAKQVNIL